MLQKHNIVYNVWEHICEQPLRCIWDTQKLIMRNKYLWPASESTFLIVVVPIRLNMDTLVLEEQE